MQMTDIFPQTMSLSPWSSFIETLCQPSLSAKKNGSLSNTLAPLLSTPNPRHSPSSRRRLSSDFIESGCCLSRHGHLAVLWLPPLVLQGCWSNVAEGELEDRPVEPSHERLAHGKRETSCRSSLQEPFWKSQSRRQGLCCGVTAGGKHKTVRGTTRCLRRSR